MVIYFNKETKRLIKKLCKCVAEKLEVDKCNFAIFIDGSEKYPIELCFSTAVDDTYASLYIKSGHSLIEILNGFMENENVEFMNRGLIL